LPIAVARDVLSFEDRDNFVLVRVGYDDFVADQDVVVAAPLAIDVDRLSSSGAATVDSNLAFLIESSCGTLPTCLTLWRA
jgi:hypothetical protein